MKKVLTASFALLVVAACAHGNRPTAMATLSATSGSIASGTVHFTETNDGVEVQADITGLAPNSVHGFHIHDKGDCGDNGNAAGGHFNPTGMAHGAPDAQSHHAGDFGNVTADANGEVHTRFTTHSISVKEGPKSVIGRSVVLHGNADDLVSQPAGNAGPRIACGVVTAMSGNQMAGSMHN